MAARAVETTRRAARRAYEPERLPLVLDPARIAIPPEICAYLTTLLQQTPAGTVALRSHVEEVSWDVQGKDVFLVPALFAAMHTAIDAYTALVAERLTVLGKVAAGSAHAPRR